MMTSKIENPFDDNDKLLLKLLSKKAKNENLLGNAGRKYLYECGIYKEWFPNRLLELTITLWILQENLIEDKDRVLEMIETLHSKIPTIILNEHVKDQQQLAENATKLFEMAYKKQGQDEFLNLLKEVDNNKTLFSEMFIKTTTKLSTLLENIKPSETS